MNVIVRSECELEVEIVINCYDGVCEDECILVVWAREEF